MMPAVVAWVDPGGMTGIARLWNTGTNFWADEFSFDQAVWSIENLCGSCGPILAIGWERYVIRVNLPQTHAHTAMEMIGVVKSAAHRHGCLLLPPGEPKTPDAVEQGMLRELGWWTPGRDDAQSAAAHLLRWLIRTNNCPPNVAAVVSAALGSL